MRPPPISCREVLKAIEHACQCYRKAEQQATFAAWEQVAGPPQPDQKQTTPPVAKAAPLSE